MTMNDEDLKTILFTLLLARNELLKTNSEIVEYANDCIAKIEKHFGLQNEKETV
jgi:hypothetical protein